MTLFESSQSAFSRSSYPLSKFQTEVYRLTMAHFSFNASQCSNIHGKRSEESAFNFITPLRG